MIRAGITPVFWSIRGAHHNDHGTDMTRETNRLRSPQQSRGHGPLLEKVGYIRTIFSKTPVSHICSIDMDECAPIWGADSGHDHWHEECGVQRCRRSSASGLMGAINSFFFDPRNGGGAINGGAAGSVAYGTGRATKAWRHLSGPNQPQEGGTAPPASRDSRGSSSTSPTAS